MKNIHILPTTKPSRLVLDDTTQNLILVNKGEALWGNQNIYITSDEEIKKGDWCLDLRDNSVFKIKLPLDEGGSGIIFKIILTTDQDLIKDGVQAVDDEFLEWFVKNPSCEEVKVELHIGSLRWSDSKNSYKIIIPEEETKKYKVMIVGNGMPKQETLEEVLGSRNCEYSVIENKLAILYRNQVKIYNTINKQQEQDKNKYSEEDMRKMYDLSCGLIGLSEVHNQTENNQRFKDLLEQFKKK